MIGQTLRQVERGLLYLSKTPMFSGSHLLVNPFGESG